VAPSRTVALPFALLDQTPEPAAHPEEVTDAVVTAARLLAIDAQTGEALRQLDEARVPAVLLKGPAIARWLYDRPDERRYIDVDLLIPAADEPAAGSALRGLGYRPDPGVGHADPGVAVNHVWLRDAAERVELHVTLIGIRATSSHVWAELAAGTQTLDVGGHEATVLGPPARALHLALHAAQHGIRSEQPLEDLRRGLARLPEAVWSAAAGVAARLDAEEAMAAGLRLLPEGREVADRLGLTTRIDTETVLRAASSPPLADGFERLSQARSGRERMSRVVRLVLPDPAFLRWWTPLARRGPAGLAAAYVWRMAWVAAHLVPGYRAWRRARKAASGG
jgi:hypothetical protein